MSHIQNPLTLLFCLFFAFPNLGISQDHFNEEVSFEVNRVLPAVSLSGEALDQAITLKDLNSRFQNDWVRSYISVEILTKQQGALVKSIHKNDTLNQAQKEALNKADLGEDILVRVQYLPENTLKHNDPKELEFTFSVDPEQEATYPGGAAQLKKYLAEKAMSEIPANSFEKYDLAVVKFTINEEGEVVDAHVFESVYQSYKNEKVENLLLETVRKMPCWKPATYANGTKVKQEFALTVGNMHSCIVPLLSIRQLD